jgi:hypothetical protein
MTSKLRSIAASTGLAIALVFSAPASANTIPLGTLSEGDPQLVPGIIGSTTNPSDTITFSLSGLDDLGTALSALPAIKVNMLQFGLTSVSASLFTSSNVLIGSLTDGSPQTFTSLAAGDYYITVNGTAINPVLGGAYGLTLLADAAAPVPGPAALLPALVGAGAIAWRRRRSGTKADRSRELTPA